MDGTPVLALWYSSTHPMVLEYSLDVTGILSIRGELSFIYFFCIKTEFNLLFSALLLTFFIKNTQKR